MKGIILINGMKDFDNNQQMYFETVYEYDSHASMQMNIAMDKCQFYSLPSLSIVVRHKCICDDSSSKNERCK